MDNIVDNTTNSITDNAGQKRDSAIMTTRTNNRGTIYKHTSLLTNTEKKDTFVSFDSDNTQTNIQNEPFGRQIPLNNQTRANAHNIRDRLANSGKAYKLRNDPETYKKAVKINGALKM